MADSWRDPVRGLLVGDIARDMLAGDGACGARYRCPGRWAAQSHWRLSRALLRGLRAGRLIVAANVALMPEYEAVLTRSEHLAAIGLSRREVNPLLAGLAALVEPVTPHVLWRPQLRDPDDEMVLDTGPSPAAATPSSPSTLATSFRPHNASA